MNTTATSFPFLFDFIEAKATLLLQQLPICRQVSIFIRLHRSQSVRFRVRGYSLVPFPFLFDFIEAKDNQQAEEKGRGSLEFPFLFDFIEAKECFQDYLRSKKRTVSIFIRLHRSQSQLP